MLGLLAAALSLRILILLEFAGSPHRSADTELFLETARRIAGGDPFLHGDTLIFSPFYSYFLAAVFAVVGESLSVVLAVQCVIGFASGVLLWWLARSLFGPLSALFTLFLHAFCGLILFYEVQLMDATFSMAFATALLAALHRADRVTGSRPWLVGGALLGTFALARPNVLLFLPVVVLWALRRSPFRDSTRARLLAAGGVVGGVLLCVLPFTARNLVQTGEPVLITAHGGINFYIGNNERATGFFTPPQGMPPLPGPFNLDLPREAAERATGRADMGDAEVSSYWFARALGFIRDHPGRAVSLTLRKAHAFLNGREIPINVEFAFFRALSPTLTIAFVPMGALLPLGLFGLVRSGRRWRDHALFHLYFATVSLSVILFFVASRYRLPVVPVLLLYAGHAIRLLIDDWTLPSRPVRLGTSMLVLAALFFFCNTGVELRLHPGYVAHQRGYALQSMNRIDEAIEWYERALEADSTLVLAHLQLARIYVTRGDAERAGDHYEAVMRLAPEDPEFRAEVERYRAYVRSHGLR